MGVSPEFPNRIYSTFLVKSFDEEQRIIEGIASSPSMDRQGDIMESKGAEFILPHPLLWQHQHDTPLGEVIAAKHVPEGIYIRAKIAAAGLLPEIDRAWTLIKARLVKGFSIGWSPLDYAPVKGGRFHVKKWRWVETSAVTVPANQEATISLVKSLDTRRPAAPGTGSRLPVTTPGASGHSRNSHMANISEQVSEVKDDLQTKSARLEELMAQEGTEGGLSDDETKELDSLTAGVDVLTKRLGRLTTLEAAMATNAKSVTYPAQHFTATTPRAQRVEVPALEKGLLFTRYALAVAAGKGSYSDTMEYAKQFTNTPQVAQMVKFYHGRKAVEGTTTGGSPGWGAELVNPDTAMTEFVELLMPATIIGRVQGFRRVPFNIPIITQTGGSTFEWVEETEQKPVGQLAFSRDTLGHSKCAGIIVMSDELVRLSRPNSEQLARNDMIEQCAAFLDRQFIQVGIAPGTTSPGSITYNVTSPAASGSDLASLKADLMAAFSVFTDASIPLSGLVVAMTSTTALGISLLTDELGQSPAGFAVTPQGGTLLGYQVIVSDSVDAGTVVIFKPSEIFLADDGQVRLDASNQATLDMTGGSPGAPVFNLWQRNCVGLRAERWIHWKKRRADVVAVIDTASYGPSVGSP